MGRLASRPAEEWCPYLVSEMLVGKLQGVGGCFLRHPEPAVGVVRARKGHRAKQVQRGRPRPPSAHPAGSRRDPKSSANWSR